MNRALKYCSFAIVFLIQMQTYAQCVLLNNSKGTTCQGSQLSITVEGGKKIIWFRNGRAIDSAQYDTSRPKKYVTALPNYSLSKPTPYGVFVDNKKSIYVASLSENIVQKWDFAGLNYAVVAGKYNKTADNDSVGLNAPTGIYVDSAGNLYVADQNNDRIMKYKAGDSTGTLVIGGNYFKPDSSYTFGPVGIFVDRKGFVYLTDVFNRVLKWDPVKKSGRIVAGSRLASITLSAGGDSTHLNSPTGVWVDSSGNVFVADANNSRIQEWKPGTSYGITVAGNKNDTAGNDSSHLSYPSWVWGDNKGNLYISDYGNGRLMKWRIGAKSGVEVMGSNSDSIGFNEVEGVFINKAGDIWASDAGNHKVYRQDAHKYLNGFYTINADSLGNYIARVEYIGGCTLETDTFKITKHNNKKIIFDTICRGEHYAPAWNSGFMIDAAGLYTAYYHNKAGCDSIEYHYLTINQVSHKYKIKYLNPGQSYKIGKHTYKVAGFYTDTLKNIKKCDSIIFTKLIYYNASLTHTGLGCLHDTLKLNVTDAKKVVLKRNGVVFKTVDYDKDSIKTGAIVAGDLSHSFSYYYVSDGSDQIYLDDSENIYVAGENYMGLKKVKTGDSSTQYYDYNNYVANGNTFRCIWGDNLGNFAASGSYWNETFLFRNNNFVSYSSKMYLGTQNPWGVFLLNDTFYVADKDSNRILKFDVNDNRLLTSVPPDPAHALKTDTTSLSSPTFFYVDSAGAIYVINNHKIIKWNAGAKHGTIVAGNDSTAYPATPRFLNDPRGVFVDSKGNIYVADGSAQRVQKWLLGAHSGLTVAGNPGNTKVGSGYGMQFLSNAQSVSANDYGDIYVLDDVYHIVTKWGSINGLFKMPLDTLGRYTATVTFRSGYTVTTPALVVKGQTSYKTIDTTICSGTVVYVGGQSYAVDGSYWKDVLNNKGCDSIIHLNLVVHNPEYNQQIVQIAKGSTFKANGTSYTTAGTYYIHYKDSYHCDSLIQTDLVVNNQKLRNSGKGCVGDTLSISVNKADKIEWIRNNKVVKTIYITDSLIKYCKTVAGYPGYHYLSKGLNDSIGLNSPMGIWVDSAENLFIADKYNRRIQMWPKGATHGITVAKYTSLVKGTGYYTVPNSVCLERSGNLIALDNAYTIRKWSKDSISKHKLYKGDSVSGTSLQKIYIDKNDTLYGTQSSSSYITKGKFPHFSQFTNSTLLYYGWLLTYPNLNFIDSSNMYLTGCPDAWSVGKYNLRNSDNNIILDSNNYTYDINAKKYNKYDNIWGSMPYTVDALGNVYLAGGSIYKYSQLTHHVHILSSFNVADSEYISGVNSIFLTDSGDIYISETDNNSVQKTHNYFSGTFKYVTDSPGNYTVVVSYPNKKHWYEAFNGSDTVKVRPAAAYLSKTAQICYGQKYVCGIDTFTISGMYTARKPDTSSSCDTLVALNLKVLPKNYTTYNKKICSGSKLNFGGKDYNVSGVYTVNTLKDKTGCDSFIYLNLRLDSSNVFNVNASICNGVPFRFRNLNFSVPGVYHDTFINHAGCDTFMNFTVTSDTTHIYSYTFDLCSKSTYHFYGKILSVAGIYYDTLHYTHRCDSVIKLNLAVLPYTYQTIYDTIQSGKSVTVNYKLYYKSGFYTDTAIYTKSNCDSVIYNIYITVTTGYTELEKAITRVHIYPNPNNGQFIIDMNTPCMADKVHMQIINMLGQVVAEQDLYNANGIIHATLWYNNLASGVYLVKVYAGHMSYVQRVTIDRE